MIEKMGLRDVVLTFQMKEEVKLVITGNSKWDFPGEIAVTVREREFPFVEIELTEQPQVTPYEVCTLDYEFSGRTVSITTGPHAGEHGTLVVAATIGDCQQNRIRLESGQVITMDGDDLDWG
jgi:hypothetical protein